MSNLGILQHHTSTGSFFRANRQKGNNDCNLPRVALENMKAIMMVQVSKFSLSYNQ